MNFMRSFLFWFVFAALAPITGKVCAQQSGQGAHATEFGQRSEHQYTTRTYENFHSFSSRDKLKPKLRHTAISAKKLWVNRKLDRDRSRLFFLICLGSAILLWGIYFIVYFLTIDATTSSALLALGGFCGVLGIIAIAATIIGFIVWMVAIQQGW